MKRAIAALVVWVASASSSFACQWQCPLIESVIPGPDDEVPTTAVVTLLDPPDDRYELQVLDADDVPVPGSLEADEDADVVALVFTPDQDLVLGETYQVLVGDEGPRFFTVTMEAADDPGEAEVLEEYSSYSAPPSCPVFNEVGIRMKKGPEVAWFEVEASANRWFGDSVWIRAPGPRITMGAGPCGPSIPNLGRGERVWYRVRAVGFDGAPGPWVEGRRRADFTCFGGAVAMLCLPIPLGWRRLRRRAVAGPRIVSRQEARPGASRPARHSSLVHR